MSTMDFDQAVALFTTYCRAKGLAQRTLETYSASLRGLRQVLATNGGSPGIPGSAELRAYLASMRERGLSATSIAIHARSIRAFFGFLVREGVVETSPLHREEMPRLPSAMPKVLDRDQMRRLIESSPRASWTDKRNRAILLTFLDTGLRLSELVHLELADLDVGQRELRVRNGKGNRDRRVYVGSGLARAVRLWLEARGLKAGATWLFTTRQGERLDLRNVERIIERLAGDAGLDEARITPHLLRHTFATHYVMNGGDPFSLQRILGHSDIKTTMIYVNLAGIGLREAHAKASPVDRVLQAR